MNFSTLLSLNPDCESPLNFLGVIAIVIVCCALGILWAIRNVRLVTNINLHEGNDVDLDE